MKYYQEWMGSCSEEEASFPAQVPGNIQADYAKYRGWGDVNDGKNCLAYEAIEDYTWFYTTHFENPGKEGERVWFVSGGIDYRFDIYLNGTLLHRQEGMFTPVELDLTDFLCEKNELQVKIYPHPKTPGIGQNRSQANTSVKPAVCYGWDWEPRLLVSGIWEETYLETRGAAHLSVCEPRYTLSDDLLRAEVTFELSAPAEIELFDPSGVKIYQGDGTKISVENPELWWCNGYGAQNLYRWTAKTSSDQKEGRIGFRRVRLVMNEGTWNEPPAYPMSRSHPPITIELNGKRVFAKGSNYVNPEIFVGMIDRETYRPQVEAAKECNLNIFRCWGGAIVDKESFFDLCDEYGIMVWQEFPLACNEYRDIPEYLAVLEQEARSIVRKIRRHACHVLWCGGNELFNSWSLMTEQSAALRLLDKVCYEEDYAKPYIMTSPLSGMAHGPYNFYADPLDKKKDIYTLFNNAHYTAYTEFGIRDLQSYERIKKHIDLGENEDFRASEEVAVHLGNTWWDIMAVDSVMMVFGESENPEKICEYSQILSAEGYKAVFEEARRQKPYCSMAINWCYNEPWFNYSNCNLLEYPNIKKPCFHTVKESNKPVTLSARFEKFSWRENGTVKLELWLLNDTYEEVSDLAEVYLESDGVRTLLHRWDTGAVRAWENAKGPEIHFTLPEGREELFKLILVSKNGYDNEYRLKRDFADEQRKIAIHCRRKRSRIEEARRMNAVLED